MSQPFNVEILFQDGTKELITTVTHLKTGEGLLHLYRRTSSVAYQEHLGTYPVAGIKRWKVT